MKTRMILERKEIINKLKALGIWNINSKDSTGHLRSMLAIWESKKVRS